MRGTFNLTRLDGSLDSQAEKRVLPSVHTGLRGSRELNSPIFSMGGADYTS